MWNGAIFIKLQPTLTELFVIQLLVGIFCEISRMILRTPNRHPDKILDESAEQPRIPGKFWTSKYNLDPPSNFPRPLCFQKVTYEH